MTLLCLLGPVKVQRSLWSSLYDSVTLCSCSFVGSVPEVSGGLLLAADAEGQLTLGAEDEEDGVRGLPGVPIPFHGPHPAEKQQRCQCSQTGGFLVLGSVPAEAFHAAHTVGCSRWGGAKAAGYLAGSCK